MTGWSPCIPKLDGEEIDHEGNIRPKKDNLIIDFSAVTQCFNANVDLIPDIKVNFFRFQWHMLIVVVPVEFQVGSDGYIGVSLSGQICLQDGFASAALMPHVGISVWASAGVTIFIARAGLQVTANLLDSWFVPGTSIQINPHLNRAPEIIFELQLRTTPLSLRLEAYLEYLLCIKWCRAWIIPYPCGIEWCPRLSWVIFGWSMDRVVIVLVRISTHPKDLTPPIPGKVRAYQYDTATLVCDWQGFQDPESDILGYKLCAGSAPLGDDYIACIHQGDSTSYVGFLTVEDMSTVHITIVAENRNLLKSNAVAQIIWDKSPTAVLDIRIQSAFDKAYIGKNTILEQAFSNSRCRGFDPIYGPVYSCVPITSSLINVSFVLEEQCALTKLLELDYGVQPADSTEEVALQEFQPLSPLERSRNHVVQLVLPDYAVVEGAEYKLVFRTKNDKEMVGYYFSLPFIVVLNPPEAENVSIVFDRIIQFSRFRSLLVFWTPFPDMYAGTFQYDYKFFNVAADEESVPFTTTFNMAQSAYALSMPIETGDVLVVGVRAVNIAMLSAIKLSECIIFDLAPPTCMGDVIDLAERQDEDDVDYVSELSYFRSRLYCFDKDSAVSLYEVAVGTVRYANDIVPRSPVDARAGLFEIQAPPWIKSDVWYYITVYVTDGAGWVFRSSSDGILQDSSPPECGRTDVRDGLNLLDSQFHNSVGPLSADWSGVSDISSPIIRFCFLIVNIKMDQTHEEIVPWICVGTQTRTSIAVNPLFHHQRYYFMVNATNAAGLTTTCNSNGVIIGELCTNLNLFLHAP
jgi:hypothetical protein